MIRYVIFGLLLAVCVSLSADSAWAAKDTERLQIQMAALSGQVADMKRVSDDTFRELRRLNELLAEQNASLRKALQDQKAQEEALQNALKDMTERLTELEQRFAMPPSAPTAAGAGGGSETGSGGTAGAPPPPPKELYSQAYADYARGNYDLAIQGFQEYIKNYPNTDFTDNAQYWIGECLYGKQRFNEAIDAWNILLRDFPSSDKLPDARVKKGAALEKLGRRSQALLEYRFVVERYPNSPAARVARDKLNPQ